jgi:hypothetical protein
LRGKAIPKEIICRPEKWRLKIWLRGDPTPLSFLQIGEESIRHARRFIEDATTGEGGDWWDTGGLCLRLADVALISFSREK